MNFIPGADTSNPSGRGFRGAGREPMWRGRATGVAIGRVIDRRRISRFPSILLDRAKYAIALYISLMWILRAVEPRRIWAIRSISILCGMWSANRG